MGPVSLFFLTTLQALTNNWWLSPPATLASRIWGGAHEI